MPYALFSPHSPSFGRRTTLTIGLALLLNACGGGSSTTEQNKASGSPTARSLIAPGLSAIKSTEPLSQGAALNTEELDDALAQAKALPADADLVSGQVAPLAAYKSGQVAQKAAAVQLPVYRFYNTQTGSHFFTASTTERESVRTNLAYMTYEGEAFMAASEASAGLKPVYRFFNSKTGLHFYTISESERDNIQANLPQFTLEGVAYYASPVTGTGFKPLYRFFLSNVGTHFYTASETERLNLQDNLSATYNYEGVSYHVLTNDCSLVNTTRTYAEPNACLLANNIAEVTITLPLSSELVAGDKLRVSGLGAGGWRISQNAMQRVQTTMPGAQPFVWTARESIRDWRSVASSADGNRLVAGEWSGPIYTSSDGGVNWTAGNVKGRWASVASSTDGNKLVAVDNGIDHFGGKIYTSTDAGRTWTARELYRNWRSVASSSDGNKLVAVAYYDQIYTSSDAGVNWTARDQHRSWTSVASSADGTKLVAGAWSDQIYTSTDAGVNWTAREPIRDWISFASSADGKQLVAAVSEGQLHTSNDTGENWAARETTRTSSVASSSDGNKLVAVVFDGQIHTSSDAGENWTARETTRYWQSVASSSDGNKLVAGTYNGQIYTAQSSTTPGAEGFLQGATGSSIELKYLGNDVFEVVNYSGTVSANAKPI
jgi:hypothetical protein